MRNSSSVSKQDKTFAYVSKQYIVCLWWNRKEPSYRPQGDGGKTAFYFITAGSLLWNKKRNND